MRVAVLCLCLIGAVFAAQSYTSGVPYRGVSNAGLEFKLNAGGGISYPYLASQAYWISQGANLVRIPFRWDRAQPPDWSGKPSYSSGTTPNWNTVYVSALYNMVTNVTGAGGIAILDMHNYARYPYIDNDANNPNLGTNFIGTPSSKATYQDYYNFWYAIATVFKNNNNVWYGLMNEPSPDTTNNDLKSYSSQNAWNLMQQGVWAVRAAGATSKILVSGTVWTGSHDFADNSGWYGVANSVTFTTKFTQSNGGPVDTNYAVELHTYFDNYYSGNYVQCLSSYSVNTDFDDVTNWASKNGIQLFLGEFAFYVAPNQIQTSTYCTANAIALINYLNGKSVNNNGPWVGWSYWAGGPFWGDDQVGKNGYDAVTAPLAGAASAEPDWWALDGSKSGCNPDSVPLKCGFTSKPVVQWLTTTHGGFGAQWIAPGQSSTSSAPVAQQSSVVATPSCANPVAPKHQCGGYVDGVGTQYSGSTCCIAGFSCQMQTGNQWYYWCMPVSAAASTTSTTSAAAASTTSTTSAAAATTASGASGGSCAAQYGQCGGIGWTGATCCVSPYTCKYSNDYYSQCL